MEKEGRRKEKTKTRYRASLRINTNSHLVFSLDSLKLNKIQNNKFGEKTKVIYYKY